jgi:hypothetical protein
MSLRKILISYLIGGLTLPPLVILGALFLIWRLAPEYKEEEDDDLSDLASKEYEHLSLTELEDKASSGVKAYKAGWITVTREYHSFVANASDKQVDSKDSATKTAYTALYKLVKKKEKDDQPQSSTNLNPQAPQVTKAVKKKNRFYGVLRHGNLFLYKSEDQKDVQHVIVLANNIVTIWPRNLRDGELFTKRTAICILKSHARRKSDIPPRSSAASLSESEGQPSTMDVLENGVLPQKNQGFFIYCDTNYEKEDWYFELIKATKRDGMSPTGTELDQLDPKVFASALHFKTADIISLIQTLHSSEGQLQTRWLNAIIGRLYLALQGTDVFEKYVEAKLLKKLSKINRPDFLEEFQVKKVEIGDSAPFISFPKLQSLNPDGSLRVSCKFTYTGKMSLQIASKASIPNFSTFQKRDLTILLAVTINKIDGPLVINIKPPPSSRIWYTFESMPDLDLTIEPVVSQRQFSYGIVTNVIEKKFKDAIRDSLVEPYWDDISFFDTFDEFYRGGIWSINERPKNDSKQTEEEVAQDLEIPESDLQSEFADDVAATLNPDVAGTTDYSHSEDNSLRSKASQSFSKRSTLNSIQNLTRKKSEASIGTSNEQFLADGSYVSREIASQDTTSEYSDSLRDRNKTTTMQVLSAETAAGKKALSNGMKRLGKWYNEKNRTSSTNITKKDKDYTPPEMISRRRAPSAGENGIGRKTSNSDMKSIGSSEGIHKSAPQAHSFPVEYMFGLDTQAPDTETGTKNSEPSRIPAMTMPGSTTESKFAPISPVLTSDSPKKSLPRRKPVVENDAIEKLHEAKEDSLDEAPIDLITSDISVDSSALGASRVAYEIPPEVPLRPSTQVDVPLPLPLGEITDDIDGLLVTTAQAS